MLQDRACRCSKVLNPHIHKVFGPEKMESDMLTVRHGSNVSGHKSFPAAFVAVLNLLVDCCGIDVFRSGHGLLIDWLATGPEWQPFDRENVEMMDPIRIETEDAVQSDRAAYALYVYDKTLEGQPYQGYSQENLVSIKQLLLLEACGLMDEKAHHGSHLALHRFTLDETVALIERFDNACRQGSFKDFVLATRPTQFATTA